MSDAVDARSAARERKTIVRQNDTFPQIPSTLACGTSGPRRWPCGKVHVALFAWHEKDAGFP
eukprot:7308704-Prymnesium_polylepis.1